MGNFQDSFDKLVKTQLDVGKVKKATLRRAATKKGLNLSEESADSLLAAMDGAERSSTELVINPDPSNPVKLSMNELQQALNEVTADIDDAMESAIKLVTEKSPPKMLESLYQDSARMIDEHRELTREFEERLYVRWGSGLDRLKMLIVIAQEAGDSCWKNARKWNTLTDNRPSSSLIDRFNAVLGLHVRSCRIAAEVLSLLKSGYADGANARWRTLHEVAVTAVFLNKTEGDIGRRYFRHAAITRKKEATQYDRHHKRPGYQPPTADQMRHLQQEYDAAVSEFGRDFEGDYGWAAHAVGKSRPTFADIEDHINLAHWRPHFKMACQSVHAGSQALKFSIGSPKNGMYAGASNFGLADPAHETAISLGMSSTALLTLRPNLDGIVMCAIMRQLTDDIGKAFLTAHKELKAEIRKRDASA